MITRARGYPAIRREHWSAIRAAVRDYLNSDFPITRFRNQARAAIRDHFTEAFALGYAEASGSDSMAKSDARYLAGRIDDELDHVDELFDGLRALRKAGGYKANQVAGLHADGYAATLDSIYGEGRARGDQNIMLTYDGEDGAESCRECLRYKGQRHRAKWWISRDLIRRNGNENFGCGRWPNCHHHFYTDAGTLYAL